MPDLARVRRTAAPYNMLEDNLENAGIVCD